MKNEAASGRAAGGRVRAVSGLEAKEGLDTSFGMFNVYEIECRDKDGNVKWTEKVKNLVVDQGLNDMLDKYLKGSAYTAAWYVGLKGAGTIAAGDTAASHAGWVELSGYSEGTRPALTLGAVAAKTVNNSASKATYSINATATVAGAFVISTNNKGGTTGILWGAANFASARAVESGDTLSVTVTASASST